MLRGSTTLTGAPGPAARLDKLMQHLGLSGSKLASGGVWPDKALLTAKRACQGWTIHAGLGKQMGARSWGLEGSRN